MKALVVFESMYGNTHLVAERIADGMRPTADVTVAPVSDATSTMVDEADLVVVGGPTHIHGMASDRSRVAAIDAASKPGSDLTIDEAARGIGLRCWLEQLPPGHGRQAAAFDTRMTGPALLTGRASRSIAKMLQHHGFDVVATHSFLVDHANHLLDDAPSVAFGWGRTLVTPLADQVRVGSSEQPR